MKTGCNGNNSNLSLLLNSAAHPLPPYLSSSLRTNNLWLNNNKCNIIIIIQKGKEMGKGKKRSQRKEEREEGRRKTLNLFLLNMKEKEKENGRRAYEMGEEERKSSL